MEHHHQQQDDMDDMLVHAAVFFFLFFIVADLLTLPVSPGDSWFSSFYPSVSWLLMLIHIMKIIEINFMIKNLAI